MSGLAEAGELAALSAQVQRLEAQQHEQRAAAEAVETSATDVRTAEEARWHAEARAAAAERVAELAEVRAADREAALSAARRELQTLQAVQAVSVSEQTEAALRVAEAVGSRAQVVARCQGRRNAGSRWATR